MAHNLATINEKPAIFYHGKPPWHGLGTELNGPATSAEAITAAQLDWDVYKVPLYVRGRKRYFHVQNSHAMIRADTREEKSVTVLGIVGKSYTPLQNRDAFAWFDSIVGRNAAVYHTAGALGDGERVWMLVKLPGEIRVTTEDITNKFLLLSNSHDGTSSVQVRFTPIRVVCQNTLIQALSHGQGVRISHSKSMEERLELAKENLGIITKRFGEIENAFLRMRQVEILENRLTEYLLRVFPDPETNDDERARLKLLQVRENSQELFETGRGNDLANVRGTLWAAYNGVAELVDYRAGSRTPDARLESAWFGTGYSIKSRAFRVAMEMAKGWLN